MSSDEQPIQLSLTEEQQEILVRKQNELAVAVASALPFPRTVGEIDAREDAAVETEGVALVDDEVVVERLQPG